MKPYFSLLIFLTFTLFISRVYSQTISVINQNLDFNEGRITISDNKNFFITYTKLGNKINYWDFSSKELIKSIKFKQPILQVSYKKNSQDILIAFSNGVFICYDVKKESIIREFKDHDTEINYVYFDGQETGAFTKKGIYTWSNTGELKNFTPRPPGSNSFNFRGLDYNGTILKCNFSKKTFTLTNKKGKSISITSSTLKTKTNFYPLGNFLYESNDNIKFKVYSLSVTESAVDCKFLTKLKLDKEIASKGVTYLVPIKLNGKDYCYYASKYNQVNLLNLPDLSIHKTIDFKPSQLAMYPLAGDIFIKDYAQKSFNIYDLKTEKESILAENKTTKIIKSLILRDRFLIQLDELSYITKWDLKLGTRISKNKVHRDNASSLDSVDIFHYLTTSQSGEIKKWHISRDEPEEVHHLNSPISNFKLDKKNPNIAYFIKNKKKINSYNFITQKTKKYSKYDLRYPNGISQDDLIGDLDYTSNINHFTKLSNNTFAFGTIDYSPKLIFASWSNPKAKELKKISFEQNSTIKTLINDHENKRLIVLISNPYIDDYIYTYNYSGYKIDTYKSNTEIQSITLGLDNTILIKEYGNDYLIKLKRYNKSEKSIFQVEKGVNEFSQWQKFTIVTSNNGETYFYDSSMTQVCKLINLKRPNNWLVINNNGLFNGTKEAFEMLKVSNGKNTFSLSSYFSNFHTPQLLLKALTNKSLKPTKAKSTSVPPVVRISSPLKNESHDKHLSIKYIINSPHKDLKKLRIYHNGKTVQIHNLNNSMDTVIETTLVLNSNFGKTNYLSAVAINDDDIESNFIKNKINFLGSSDNSPNLYIFTIGINEYKNPKYNLSFAVNDALSISNSLKERNRSLYNNIEVISITNQNSSGHNIKQKLKELQAKMKENDVFIFYYAGHGDMYGKINQKEFVFVTHDITNMYGNDQEIINKGISDSFLKKYSLSINPQKQLFIIDACHSGGLAQGYKSRGGQQQEKRLAQLARSTGTFWITASNTEQTASEITELKHGVFTHIFLEGVNQSNGITIQTLSSYIQAKLPNFTESRLGKAQYPMIFGYGQDFPITGE